MPKKKTVQHQEEEKSPQVLINEKNLENHITWLGYGIIICLITGGFFGLKEEWAQIVFALGGGITIYAGAKSYKIFYEKRLHQYKKLQELSTIAEANEEKTIVRQKPAMPRPRVATWKQQRNKKTFDLSDEKTYWEEFERLKAAIVTMPKRCSTRIAHFFQRSNTSENVTESGEDSEKETNLDENKEQETLSPRGLQKKRKPAHQRYRKKTPPTNNKQKKYSLQSTILKMSLKYLFWLPISKYQCLDML